VRSGIVVEPTAALASEEFKVDTVESWFRASVMMDTNSFWNQGGRLGGSASRIEPRAGGWRTEGGVWVAQLRA
jgi:hypothetical protein